MPLHIQSSNEMQKVLAKENEQEAGKDNANMKCLNDILNEAYDKNFSSYFKILNQNSSQNEGGAREYTDGDQSKQKNTIVKIEVKSLELSNGPHQLLTINDITHVLANERTKLKHNFSQQLTATLSHEQMTPLNAILNVSDCMIIEAKDDIEDHRDRAADLDEGTSAYDEMQDLIEEKSTRLESMNVIWSQAKLLSFLITSQMTQTKINMNNLKLSFSKLKEPLSQLITSFLGPFFTMMNNRGLSIEIRTANNIPAELICDWQIYQEIMFHIIQNAVKFNCPGGKIIIAVSYQDFEQEFKLDQSQPSVSMDSISGDSGRQPQNEGLLRQGAPKKLAYLTT